MVAIATYLLTENWSPKIFWAVKSSQLLAGHSCLDPSQSPSICPGGTYSLAGSSQCTVSRSSLSIYRKRPANYWNTMPLFAIMQSCPEGSYSLEGDGGCLKCPPGHNCRNGTTFTLPTACAPGDYSSGGMSTCIVCAEGEYRVHQSIRISLLLHHGGSRTQNNVWTLPLVSNHSQIKSIPGLFFSSVVWLQYVTAG